MPQCVEPLFDHVGDCGLARARQPGEPKHSRLLMLQRGMGGAGDVQRLPVDVLRAAQAEVQHPGANGAVGQLVDQDDPAQRPVAGIGIEHQRLVGGDLGHADGVEVERLGSQPLHRVDIDRVLGRGDRDGDGLRPQLQPVGTAHQQRIVVQPDQRGFELVRHFGRGIGGGDHIAARTVDLVRKAQRDRLARNGLLQIAIQRDDPGDGAGLARWQDAHAVAGADGAAGDQAGKTPEIQIGPVDPLHRHPQRCGGRSGGVDLNRFQMLDQRRAIEPRRVFGTSGDVIALEARNRQRGEGGDADAVGKGTVIGDDPVEHGLVVPHQIHLVHGQHDVANADLMAQKAVAAGLGQHALARVDQDHGEVGGRCAGHHVAGVLFMPRAIRDDELALFGAEKAIGDVDRDALFAFGGKAINQQREVDLLPLRALLLAVGFQRGQLILEDHLAVIEQPPDQGGLAIVHAAAGDEAQHRLMLMLVEIGVDVLGDEGFGLIDRCVGHQKYPCCFFTSIPAPPASLSIARPWRSLVVVSSVS